MLLCCFKLHKLCTTSFQGQTCAASYLLSLGADIETADSSGNRAVHYAAAYGWIHIMQMLHKSEADIAASNDWLLTPLAVAYLKAHMHVVHL